MIRKVNGSGRRILTFPAVHPCEDIAPSTLISSLITLSHSISNFQCKTFPCNKRNAATAIRFVQLLQPFIMEIRNRRQPGLPDSATLSLSELHLTFQKLLFLLEDAARGGARLLMLMESGRAATQFRVLARSVSTALEVFPFDSVELPEEVVEEVVLLMRQARNARFEAEADDKRALMCVMSVLTRFENRVDPIEGDLKWVLDYIGVKEWSDCNKEMKFLDGEIGFDCLSEGKRKVGFLSSLMGFMCYCRCLVMKEVVVGGSGRDIGIENEMVLLNGLNTDDFRCPISLELMSDPVTIETGHTYDRSSILKWFKSGNAICPKTGKRLVSTELVPNLALRRLIQRYCHVNTIPNADPGRRNRGDIMRTSRLGSLAAEESMRMVAGFLGSMLEIGSVEEKNRAAYEMRLLSKASIFNRSCLVEADSVPLLLKLLSSRDSLAQENVIATLLNLSKYSKSRASMVENSGLELIVGVLKNGLKTEARQHAAAVLFYLASDAEYRKLIGEEPDAIPSLIRLIESGNDRAKKNGLVAMYGILINQPENHKRVLLAAEAIIPLLVDTLKQCDEKEDLATDSLAILATLAEKSDGTIAILRCTEALFHSAVEILSSSTSRVGKEHCVSLLLSMAVNGGFDVVADLVNRPSLMGSLYSQLSEGTSRGSKKASALIRVLHDFHERRSSGFKSSSAIPQERFVHVW